jgi:hypothetical protein
MNNSVSAESCLFSYAYLYSDLNTCELINTSLPRNTCKAVISLDESYCNILEPANRSECNYEIDLRYQHLAVINTEPSFCNYIQNLDIQSNCRIISKEYENFRSDIDECKKFAYVNNSLNYQTSIACYIYHIKNSNDSICNDVDYFIKKDCANILLNNLSFCYDKSGNERDWCLANFAYYYDNINLCIDASNEDNCLYTVGYWFNEIDYCLSIKDSSRKNACINSYVNYCEENINNCISVNYCELLTSSVSKNNCILKKVKNEIKFINKVW